MNEKSQYRAEFPTHKKAHTQNQERTWGEFFTNRVGCWTSSISPVHKTLLLFCILMVSCGTSPTQQQQDSIPVEKPYLDQTLPGNTPELFAPGIVSTEHHEGSLVVHPDGNEIYFWVYFHSKQKTEIYASRFADQSAYNPYRV